MPDADRIAQLPAAAPPANIEAEQAVLGALLLNNDAVDRVHPLRAEHFTEPAHRRIFEAIRRLTDRGQVANPVTLKGYFEKDDALIEVGGAIYLARLAGAATSVASAAHYARAVRDLAIRRELLQAAHDVAHEAAHPDADDDSPAAIIDRAEARIYALRDVDPRGGPVALDVAVDDALNHAEVAAQAPGGMLGVTTGLHELDRITGGLQAANLFVIGGRPSMGKTALGLHMALAVAQGGAGVLFVSLEMSQRELGIRAVCALASEPRDVIPYSDAARGRIDPEQTARLRGAAQQLRGLPLCIDDRAGLNLAGLRATARQQARRWRRDGVPFRLIVVDHMGLVGERAGRNENETLRLGRISAGLKALAKDLGIAVLALHQLNRGVEARDNKRPTLADLRDSGAIEQDADAVAFVYRGEYYVRRNRPTDPDAEADWHAELAKVANKVEVILAKQRQGETGTVAAYCDIAGNLFRDGRQY